MTSHKALCRCCDKWLSVSEEDQQRLLYSSETCAVFYTLVHMRYEHHDTLRLTHLDQVSNATSQSPCDCEQPQAQV